MKKLLSAIFIVFIASSTASFSKDFINEGEIRLVTFERYKSTSNGCTFWEHCNCELRISKPLCPKPKEQAKVSGSEPNSKTCINTEELLRTESCKCGPRAWCKPTPCTTCTQNKQTDTSKNEYKKQYISY